MTEFWNPTWQTVGLCRGAPEAYATGRREQEGHRDGREAMKLLETDPVRRLASEVPRGVSDARRIFGVEQAVRRLLVGGVLPIWLGAGLADWYLHRRTHIQDTAGPLESATHLVMFAETGVPILLGLFCEVNAGVLTSAYGAAAVHSGTAYFDQAYAEERRRVSPVEQHVHSLLEVCPLTAALLLTALHWDQALALTGQGKAEFGLRFKRRDPLSARGRVLLLGAVALFGVLPYAEELWRCWRTHSTMAALPAPELPATETLRIAADGSTTRRGTADEGAADQGTSPEDRYG